MRNYFELDEANVLYGFSAFLLILFSLFSSDLPFNGYAFVAETMVFLGPVLFMAWYMRIDIKSALSIKFMTKKQWRNSFYFFLFLIPISIFVNLMSAYITGLLGFNYDNALPVAQSIPEVILQVMIIGLVTAVSEEFFFRGMLFNAFWQKTRNIRFSILASAFLFAILHFDIQNFLNPFFLGAIFALVNRQTGSIWSSVLGHTLINSFVVLMIANIGGAIETQDTLGEGSLLSSLLTFGVIAIVSSVFALYFFRQLKRESPVDPESESVEQKPQAAKIVFKAEKSFLIPLAVLLFYCLMMTLMWLG